MTGKLISRPRDYHWVCIQCFNDLHEQLGWTVAEE